MFSFSASPRGCLFGGLPRNNTYRKREGQIKLLNARKPCIHAATKNPADGYHAAWAGTKSMGKYAISTVFSGFYG
jgi:hypothetical protein